ncbi:hypothetical protein ACK323_04455 [Aeromonas enteropelogenes]|uniref:hypothetical protein n=1 Tax=Aeromonas enteropelogenes TaxID=29489 RepID=UPI003988D0BD
MTDVFATKIVNTVAFKINNKSWKDAQNKIKRLAGLWHKSSQGFSKAMEQGRRASTLQAKATDRQTRTELRAYRTRKDTMKADNIRHAQMIKDSVAFRQQLQKTNMEFLKGSLSAKERAATIGQLTKQYRSLNQQASRYNQSSKALGAINKVRQGVASVTRLGVAAAGVGVVGGAAIAHNQYNKVKGEGQKYEQLTIGLMNTFQGRAKEVSDIIARMANENGSDLIDLGNNLVEFVSLMTPLGVSIDDAIKKFQQTQNAMQSYGISGERAAGFQTQLTQALDQNTLDSFKESFAWAPQLRADLLAYVEKEMKIKPKDFMANLTNGKYSLKDTWFAFLNDNASKYASMSSKFKQSSIADDARASNALSLAIYRVFESSGFKDAMKFTNAIIISWANTLENNSDKIGQVFANLYKIASELGDGGFKVLSNWLAELTAQDIKGFFHEVKSAVQDFAYVVRSVANFIRSFIPDAPTPTPMSIAQQRTADRQAQTSNWANSASTYGPKITIPQPTFKAPSFEDNLVSSRVIRSQSQPSNFSGKLSLKIDTEVNKKGFADFVDYRIDNNMQQTINLLSD